ncbi:MAG: hypothetical protein Q6367_000885 [Candidatus Freyarchaeota archaeon]
MDIFILVRLLIIVILVAIIAYLAHVFIKKREISTLVLLAFFLVYCSERVYAVLGDSHLIINDWVLEISLGMILSTTALMIPIVMLRFRDFYIFPPLVGIALIAVNAVSSYYRNLVVYLFNIIFYLMGFNIWYPVVDLINTLYIQNDYIAMLANPVNSLLIPDPSYVYLLVSGGLLAAPSFILFAILAWREKSGKALGFLIGLLIILSGAAISTDVGYLPFEIVGIGIVAAGIFGLIDKYLYKKNIT